MKILLFNHEFPQLDGEAGETCLYLLREYAKIREMQIDFVTTSVDDKYHLLKMGSNVSIHRLPITNNADGAKNFTRKESFRFAWRAYKFSLDLAKKNEYDLSHSFFSFPSGLTSLLLNRKIRLPYIVSLQSLDISSSNGGLTKAIIARVWKGAYFVIAGSLRLRESVLATFPKKEIGLIGRGIDVESFFPKEDMRKTDQFTILCDSEVTPIKGIRFLVQAFKILSSRYGQVRMLVVGDGDEKKSLEDLARGLGIAEKIIFLGNVSREKSLAYYQAADVFVLPSLDARVDNGIAVRCALACGLAVVATPVNGVEELVVDQRNGFLVKISTADDLAEKIEKLLLDENLRVSMAKNSLELAQQLSWKNIANQYLDLYVKTKNIFRIQKG